LAGVNHVLLLDRNDLNDIIHHFKEGEWEEAKVILEQPPETREVEWEPSAPPTRSNGRKLSRRGSSR
jgi:restriction system protein